MSSGGRVHYRRFHRTCTLTLLSTCSNIPLLECTPRHKRQSSAFLRDFDALKSCLDAIFHSKIIEARKYLPTVTQALKNGILSDVLVPELVQWFLEFGVLLSSEQFDLIVKFMNCALVDEHSALLLLPLTTIIYRVIKHPWLHACTCTCTVHACTCSVHHKKMHRNLMREKTLTISRFKTYVTNSYSVHNPQQWNPSIRTPPNTDISF